MRTFCFEALKKTFQKVCRFRVFEEKYGCTPHIGGKKTYLKSHQVFRERAFPYFHDEIQELVLFHLVTNLANMFISFFACFYLKTLPKAQWTRGLSSAYQSNLMGHITSSNSNLDQTFTSCGHNFFSRKISTAFRSCCDINKSTKQE